MHLPPSPWNEHLKCDNKVSCWQENVSHTLTKMQNRKCPLERGKSSLLGGSGFTAFVSVGLFFTGTSLWGQEWRKEGFIEARPTSGHYGSQGKTGRGNWGFDTNVWYFSYSAPHEAGAFIAEYKNMVAAPQKNSKEAFMPDKWCTGAEAAGKSIKT